MGCTSDLLSKSGKHGVFLVKTTADRKVELVSSKNVLRIRN
jgi:hypothetical protein